MPLADGRRRTDDRAVGLGPDRNRHQVCRHADTGARARSAGVPVEHIRVSALTAASTPTARGTGRAKICPLAQIRLAKEHCPRRSQPGGDAGILRRHPAAQGQRAGGSRHPIGGVDVVLQQNRHSVHRATRPLRTTLAVELVGDREGIRVGFEQCAQRRPPQIVLLDPSQIGLGDRTGSPRAGRHPLLQRGDGGLFQVQGEFVRHGSRRRSRRLLWRTGPTGDRAGHHQRTADRRRAKKVAPGKPGARRWLHAGPRAASVSFCLLARHRQGTVMSIGTTVSPQCRRNSVSFPSTIAK